MPEVTLEQVLNARDKRALLQKKLLASYACPLVSFTMNIAGPKKTSSLIKRAFLEGIRFLDENLPKGLIKHRSLSFESTGFEAMYAVDTDAACLKDITPAIEENSSLGRLFDMDVISPCGEKLGRKSARRCLICGEPVYACSSRRIHSVKELEDATGKIITDYFAIFDRKKFAALASKSLVDEVNTTPKPGLVDQRNSGSHTDMDRDTFLKSIDAIAPFFDECIKIGQENRTKSPPEVFVLLREAGLRAEENMFAATQCVNTHKGIIYSLGIILGSLGMLWTAEAPVPPMGKLLDASGRMVKNTLEADFSKIGTSTAGGRLFLKYGISGIRGEAAKGFPAVTSASLPAYKNALRDGLSSNDAGVVALLQLIAKLDDTNLYNRGGKDGALFAKNYARNLLKNHPYPSKTQIEEMDDIFISKNLSPGGSADLLAITYFLYSLGSME